MSDPTNQLTLLREEVARLGALVQQIVLHRTIQTAGGDYAEGDIDKRTITQYTLAVEQLIIATRDDLGATAAQAQTEQLYLEEIRWRYADWRTRYVPLAMHAQRQRSAERATQLYEREQLVFAGLRQAFAEVERPETGQPDAARFESWSFSDLRNGLQTAGDLLLLGPPGGGKTTALWRLALDLAEDGHDRPDTRLPVFVRLGGRQVGQSLADLLQHELQTASLTDADQRLYELPGHRALASHLEHLVRAGRLVLLWDGLNETPRDLFESTARDLDAFRRTYPGRINTERNQHLITCRTDDYALLVESCKGQPPLVIAQATIQGLDPATIRLMILRRLGETAGHALLAALERPEYRALAELARTPLLLTMLCAAYEAKQALPDNRGKLIQAFVQTRSVWEREHAPTTWLEPTIQTCLLYTSPSPRD